VSTWVTTSSHLLRDIPELPADIQAILTVLGRRSLTYKSGEDFPLHLMKTDLRKANLRGAHLEGTIFWDAHLEGASLIEAHLELASLFGANLAGAYLMGAHLNMADLQGANLLGAHLRAANLAGAVLGGASMEGAVLADAKGLNVDQLSTVRTLYGADLDPEITAQIEKECPYLFEKPKPDE